MSNARPRLGRPFWGLWSSVSAANLADGIRVSAVPLLAVFLDQPVFVVAALAAMEFLPWVLFGPYAGALVDKRDAVRVMRIANGVRATSVIVLAVVLVVGEPPVWLLFAVAFLLSLGECLFDTGSQTVVPKYTRAEALPRANSVLSTAWIAFNEFIGPVVGSVTFGLTRWLPFAIQGVFFGAAAATLRRPPKAEDEEVPLAEEHEAPPSRVRDGLQLIIKLGNLRRVVLAGVAVAAADSLWFAVLVFYITAELGAPAESYGLLLSVAAVGGLLGGFLLERISTTGNVRAILVFSTAALAAVPLALAFTSSILLVGALLFISSAALAAWNIAAVTLRQTTAPPEALGRVMGTSRALVSAGAGLSALLGGLIAETIDVRAAFIAAVPLTVIALALTLRIGVVRPSQGQRSR